MFFPVPCRALNLHNEVFKRLGWIVFSLKLDGEWAETLIGCMFTRRVVEFLCIGRLVVAENMPTRRLAAEVIVVTTGTTITIVLAKQFNVFAR